MVGDDHVRSFIRRTRKRTDCGMLSQSEAKLIESPMRPIAAFCSESAWYCLRTHPKHEHIAAAQLGHLPDVEVFNPQLRLERRTRRGPVRFTESVFPNYLFARFVLETTLEKVRYTPSVKTVLHFGARVATIADAVIEDLRRTVAGTAGMVFTDTPLEGEEAEISSGPLQGEKGIVARVMPARQRVEILLEIMGRPLSAELSLSLIIFKRKAAAHRWA